MNKKKSANVAVVERSETDAKGERPVRPRNNVRKIRQALLMSKAELARKAGLSALTIDRIESGYECRVDTKRKIILALGMTVSDREEVFGRDENAEEDT